MLKRLDDLFLAMAIFTVCTNNSILVSISFALVSLAFIAFLVKGELTKYTPIISIVTLIIVTIFLKPGIFFAAVCGLIFGLIFMGSLSWKS